MRLLAPASAGLYSVGAFLDSFADANAVAGFGAGMGGVLGMKLAAERERSS
jgi:hypothetical protein